MARWLQLRQLSGQYVYAFIEVFFKLWLRLQVSNPEPVLVIKFNSSLLFQFPMKLIYFKVHPLIKPFSEIWSQSESSIPDHPTQLNPQYLHHPTQTTKTTHPIILLSQSTMKTPCVPSIRPTSIHPRIAEL